MILSVLTWALLSQNLVAAESSFFSYALKATPAGYLMHVEMLFGPDVSLNRAVANFRDANLVHELYANSEPDVDTDVVHAGTAQTYQKLRVIKNYGLHTRMLSNCTESVLRTGMPWHRRCELDTAHLDGGKVMGSKIDDVVCSQAGARGQVACQLEVTGLIKDYFVISSSILTVKAKAQALTNWGRFWYFTETGSISARYSNELYDHSELARNVEGFSEAALKLANQTPFELAAQWRYEGQVAR